MTKEIKSIVLTAEQIRKQGFRVTDAMARLSMLQNYSNTLMLSLESDTDKLLALGCLKKFVSDVYDQSEILFRELDSVAIHLLECDSEAELKAYGVTIAGGKN